MLDDTPRMARTVCAPFRLYNPGHDIFVHTGNGWGCFNRLNLARHSSRKLLLFDTARFTNYGQAHQLGDFSL